MIQEQKKSLWSTDQEVCHQEKANHCSSGRVTNDSARIKAKTVRQAEGLTAGDGKEMESTGLGPKGLWREKKGMKEGCFSGPRFGYLDGWRVRSPVA